LQRKPIGLGIRHFTVYPMGCTAALRRRRKACSFPRVDAVYDPAKGLILASLDNQGASPMERARQYSPSCESFVKLASSARTTLRKKSSLKRHDFRRTDSRVSWNPVLSEVIQVQEIKRSTSRVLPWIKKLMSSCLSCWGNDACPVQTTRDVFWLL